jgi:hypothetical protein
MSEEQVLASRFRRLVELREKRDLTKSAAESAERDYREYESEVLELMLDGPISGTMKFDLGGEHGTIAFTPRETKFGRIVDAEAALEHFEQRGEVEEMTSKQIQKRKLNELVRELLEQGKPMPDGIDFYTNRGITISRKS